MVETTDDTRALARLCVVNISGDTVLEVASPAAGFFMHLHLLFEVFQVNLLGDTVLEVASPAVGCFASSRASQES